MDQDEAGRLINRLRRVEGQSRGLQRMIEQGRPCEEIFTQLAATKAALDRVGVLLISLKMRECLNEEARRRRRLPRGRREGPRGLSQVRPLREVADPGRRWPRSSTRRTPTSSRTPRGSSSCPRRSWWSCSELTGRRDRRRLRRRHRHVLHPARRRGPARARPRSRRAASSSSTACAPSSRRSRPSDNVQPVLTEDGRAPLDDGVAERMLIVNVLHHVDDDPDALAEIFRLLAPGGLLVAAEFAQMDRPVGPANDHVLSLDQVRALLTGAGLSELAVYEPGAVGLYHNVIVTEKPARERAVRDGAGAGRRRPGAEAGAPGRPSLVSHVKATHGPGLDAVARASRRALRRLVRHRPARRDASPSRSTSSAPPRRRKPSPRTRRRSAACCARSRRAGAEPFVADSPGGPNGPAKVARAYKLSGIADVCAAEGVQIVDVEDDRTRQLDAPEGRLYRSFPIGKAFVDADAIVQVGVLKTHQLMRLTGGVKLTYGVIPGLGQGAPARQGAAARGLRRHAPRPAPRRAHRGSPSSTRSSRWRARGPAAARRESWTPCSRPATAWRSTRRSPTAPRTSAASVHTRRRVGAPRAPRPLRPLPPRRRPHRARARVQAGAPRHAGAPAAVAAPRGAQPHHGAAAPRGPDACIRCNECAAICGTRAIAMDPLPDYDDAACVRCFACTEVCPTAAIDNVSPLLVRLVLPQLTRGPLGALAGDSPVCRQRLQLRAAAAA